ncbi:Versicolorin B synthase [Alternaria arborescens]|nr:Versicolorin B synthase [Alternaria arborescens]
MLVLGTSEAYPPQSLIDWDLLSTAQSAAGNRRIHYAQGKTLGGSSAINTMAYHRGTAGSYQRWADLVGDQSYTYDKILHYFKKSATVTPPDLAKRNAPNATVRYNDSAFDNALQGPLQVSWANWVDPAQSWLVRASQAVGQKLSVDGFSSDSLNGGAWVPTTIDPKHATRSTSKSSYLDDKKGKSMLQLTIYLHSQASRVIFDKDKNAIGVAVLSEGDEYMISARKEVVLSAGVFHSTQLLMISGVGPAATLSQHAIPVVADIPGVDQNLSDQIFFNVLRSITVPSTGAYLSTATQQAIALQQYSTNASGPYSSAGGYLSFEKLPLNCRANFSSRTEAALSGFPSDWPEIEYFASGFPSGDTDFPTIGAISGTLLTPSSRGSVAIRSASILDQPIIDLGWLTDSVDEEVMVAAFKRVREVWDSPALVGVIAGPEIAPDPNINTTADILNFIKQNAQPIWHASSTCSMGKTPGRGAVVDSRANVFGVQGLRVVDISVFPFSLTGHPQASVYMFAEKIADEISKTREAY